METERGAGRGRDGEIEKERVGERGEREGRERDKVEKGGGLREGPGEEEMGR